MPLCENSLWFQFHLTKPNLECVLFLQVLVFHKLKAEPLENSEIFLDDLPKTLILVLEIIVSDSKLGDRFWGWEEEVDEDGIVEAVFWKLELGPNLPALPATWWRCWKQSSALS